MNKLTLNTIDETKEFDFEKSSIFTVIYSSKLKPNSIHSPNAAKIIIENNLIIKSFIVLQPLVNVKSNGDLIIHTPSTLEQAMLRVPYSVTKKDIKSVKKDVKMLKAKFELGISIQELIDMNYSEARFEAMTLEARVENPYKGGGF